MRRKIIGILIFSVILLSVNMTTGLKFLILEKSSEWLMFGWIAVILDLVAIMSIAICFALEYSDN